MTINTATLDSAAALEILLSYVADKPCPWHAWLVCCLQMGRASGRVSFVRALLH
jgi:hypothetical protein